MYRPLDDYSCFNCTYVKVTEQLLYYISFKLHQCNITEAANVNNSSSSLSELDSERELEQAASDESAEEAYATERGLAGRAVEPPTNADMACLRYVSIDK